MTDSLNTLSSLRLSILRRRFLGTPLSPNSKVMRLYKVLVPQVLTAFQQAMLIGLMLGDVSLKFNKSLTGASIQFEWGDKHQEYAFYVWHILYPFCIELPRRQVRVNANGNTVVTWCYQTITHPVFLFLHTLFIVNGLKHIIPSLLMEAINPVSLAFWFMDDGGQQDYRGYGLQFHTQGFTVDEVQSLCDILTIKFGLDCWVKFNKQKPIIAVSGNSYSTFFGLVCPYIHESMRYKFPTGSRSVWPY